MEQNIREALESSALLLKEWQKPSPFGGYGWHELTTSDHAGAHASCAALQLIAHPGFPIDDSVRQQVVDDVAVKFLRPLTLGESSQADEARHSTVKVANLLSTCAAIGRNPSLSNTFDSLIGFGRGLATDLAREATDLGWGHWLSSADGEPRCLATASAVEAVHHYGLVDGEVKDQFSERLDNLGQRLMEEFIKLTAPPITSADVLALWQHLPLLRTIALLDYPNREDNAYREIFNAYISRDVFGWGLTSTEDFQKFNDRGEPKGTDYVSFNTTAGLVSAVTAAVRTRKLDLAFFDWTTPFLADWSECIKKSDLPTPRRFSFVQQTLSCLQGALDLHHTHSALPRTVPMNINPTVFQGRGFKTIPNQGFYATPFELQEFTTRRDQFQSYITAACATYQGGVKGLKLIPGDHNFTGPGVMARIWQHINESSFMIAACFGANSNVYYEIGIAHTLGKPVLLLGRAGHEPEDIKFDLQGVRYEALKDVNDPSEIQAKVHNFLGEALRF